MIGMTQGSVELVVGADGMIGGALLTGLRASGRRAVGTSRRPDAGAELMPLDLGRTPSVWTGPPVSVAYLCAAVARLDACRADPSGSARVNIDGPARLARLLAAQGAYIVFLSTNHVFDGTLPHRRPDEPTCPLNEYGRQKGLAEQEVLKLGPAAAVLRLTKILGERVTLFEDWIKALRRGERIRPFADLSMAPVPLPIVVEVLARLGSLRLPGVHHLSGDHDVPYAEIAGLAAEIAPAPRTLVEPALAQAANPRAEPPPRHTTLDMAGLPERLGIAVPPVEATIRAALRRAAGAD